MKSHAWHRRFMQLGGILALALLAHLGGPPDAQSQAAIGSGLCSGDTTRQCATNNDCTNPSAGTCTLPLAGGDTIPNSVCMQTAAGFALQCTANDVRIARTTHLTFDPCTQPGATTKISFVAEFNLTAQDRYDIGVW